MRCGTPRTTIVSPKSSVSGADCRASSWAHADSEISALITTDARRKTGILSERERPQRQCAGMRRLDRHQHLPRGSETWRERKSSPGSGPRRSPSRLSRPVVLRARVTTRYSGGAAPAFHRFPWLPFAINCSSKLPTTKCPGKRKNHCPANDDSESDEVPAVDRADAFGRRQVDHRNGVKGYIVCQKTAECTSLEDNGLLLLELCASD